MSGGRPKEDRVRIVAHVLPLTADRIAFLTDKTDAKANTIGKVIDSQFGVRASKKHGPTADPSPARSSRSIEPMSGAGFQFYVGLDDLYYAFRFERAFISVNRLRDRKSPFKVQKWIMDSGAFTEITTHGHYRTEPVEYAREIERWQYCGTLECAVSQDWMCEPFVTAKTGLTVRNHQRLTVERFDALRAATAAPLLPVLQGFKPHEYLDHLAMYGNALAAGARVGVGSVCKRNSHPAVIEYILRGIKRERPDLRLHGFGLKLTALQRPEIRALLYSSDSMAWSLNARKNGRDAHDWREAEAYRVRVEEPNQSLELWN